MSHDRVKHITKELVEKIGIPFSDISLKEVVGQNVFCIQTEEENKLIGLRGETIRAIDYLVKKITEKEGLDYPHFLIDVNGYREKHIQELKDKAVIMAERARSFQYDVELTPMSAYERLIIHTALAETPNIKTESCGEGRERRVMIRYVTETTEVV